MSGGIDVGKEPRSPERIVPTLEKIKEAWEIYPDMRLGQLLTVCTRSAALAGIEDEELLAGVQQYIDDMKRALRNI